MQFVSASVIWDRTPQDQKRDKAKFAAPCLTCSICSSSASRPGLAVSDSGTVRSSEELAHAAPDLCDELHVVVLEQRAGRPRQGSWKRLAERTDVDSVRNLCIMMIQTEQIA